MCMLGGETKMFIFENLEAYKKAMIFTKRIFGLKNQIKDRTIKDQLLRATLSIPLNIAEGQGRIHKKRKASVLPNCQGFSV